MTATDVLICPKCKAPLNFMGGSLVCEKHHTYDVSRSGYVNLINTNSQKESGDSKEMARARQAFLSSGAYAPLRDAMCKAVGTGGVLLDAGCGEGYYTSAMSAGFDLTLGFDLSKASVDLAAKRARAAGIDGKTFFGVGSVYELPVADGSVNCVSSIFAPCATEEFSRVLRDGGRVVLACAGAHHLEGMKDVLYESVRENTERADLPSGMRETERQNVSYTVTLDSQEQIRALYMMTPYCHRTSPKAEQRLLELRSLETLLDFEIRVYQKD